MTDLSSPQPPQGVSAAALDLLLSLARRARHASDSVELDFLAVNEGHALVPYRQAALWFEQEGIRALSGVVQKEANAPYVQWLEQLCRALHAQGQGPRQVTSVDVPEALAREWGDWLPVYLLWLPMSGEATTGALLLMRDTPWQPIEVALLDEWRDVLQHAFEARLRSEPPSWRRRLAGLRRSWRRPRRLALLAGLIIALGCLPIHLTVLAPGELVPANPATLRAPMDGVLGAFMVEPNQQVVKDQPLFTFDEAALTSRLEVARQALVTAEAEYRQTAQMAVYDPKAKSQLAILAGKIEERRAESDYLQGQLQRSRVVAPQDGIALFDDPSEWIGKPVTTGERIMRIALPQDVEIQAWLAVGDAIPLEAGAPVRLYLNASPLTPVAARLRYIAHDAEQQPDGSYAYRVRATLDATTDQRVGLKGTVRLSAEQVPLAYWVLRRPLAAVRQMLGV
ncbi:HlyD family efflux transporter periplasmic adaptor subunit [Pseudomonas sp. 21LCFQ02]|uniref:efflux RND transporter periplasmic adaptor subunit n=1 Tax=unclassified Pseudomonas TaxID=196821 RepID=UPI0004F60C79|nr:MULTISPECIES: HlyD family efflux transporter periplasmic adaptor subunit [unclassified Pseudomonas]MCO8163563.1 HlyD family efflux transporter periplasmic adaptor subunit [Pseudomonas sp. 21LCFQ010]MCO8169979.1 HlyD family efflux transporter periplasmic adaptor subunit [Pseudomonas sp. 21LCFQ02]MCQ9426506.1 HlyD family efflux transporter periplasmic adaptor subunit [Pseudomonas sp. LJDD11]BAP40737.1 HlyD family secretion protein [Pseudomonas sp. StFLB209]